MEGDPANGLPDFADLEGAYAQYSAKPKGVGNYLEYDHVVEASLAEKARDMDLSAPAFSGGLEDAIVAGAESRGSAAAAEPAEGEEKPATAGEIKKRALQRIASLSGSAFAGKGAAGYERDKAGTVALYRPVHREVTREQRGLQGDILQDANLTGAREKLVSYALSDPEDPDLKTQAIADLHKAVQARFDGAIAQHSADIKKAYELELKDFLAINSSKKAGAKMTAVIERVNGTLKSLRDESVGLIK